MSDLSQANARRIAYLSLQAVVEGQDSWAAVWEVIHGFENLGWTVDLYCPEYGEDRSPGLGRRFAEFLRVQRQLKARLAEYDAVYVRAHMMAYPTARRARAAGIPVIQESNGSYEDAFIAWPSVRPLRPVLVWMQERQYVWADAIISVSKRLADWLAEETGRGDIEVSPNGANHTLFEPGAERYPGLPEHYAVFFGQFAPWQGIPSLLEAAANSAWPQPLPLVVVGDGMLRPEIETAAAENPVVRYIGQLPYADVPKVVAGAAVSFVLTYAPDRAGYSPLKLFEAMSCGVPVVCSDTEGQAEFVRAEKCGLVVAPGDAGAIARAVATLAADPVAAREMGANGRAAVEREYSWAARARQRAAVVESAIERCASPRRS